jgi:TetR/AcrR family transcriptional regulator
VKSPSRTQIASTQKVEKASSRDQLLIAASALMIERGAIDISLSELAKRSGLNSALVKYYFGDKQGLLLALVEYVLGTAIGQMEELLTMDLSPVEKLKMHVKGIITVYFRYPYINRLIHYMFEDPEAGQKVGETISRPLASVQRKLVEQGIEAGLFKPIDPMLFYFIVLGACDHLFFGQLVLRTVFGIEKVDDELRRSYTNTLLDLVLTGMLASPAGAKSVGRPGPMV